VLVHYATDFLNSHRFTLSRALQEWANVIRLPGRIKTPNGDSRGFTSPNEPQSIKIIKVDNMLLIHKIES